MKFMMGQESLAFLAMRQYEYSAPEPCYFLATRGLVDNRVFVSNRGRVSVFPLYGLVNEAGAQAGLFSITRRTNLSAQFLRNLRDRLAIQSSETDRLPDGLTPETIFHYAYAVFHSPTYRTRYAEFLKIDFPRLPLTSSLDLFRELARLGGELVALHLVEAVAQQALSVRYDKAAKAWRYEVAKGQRLPVTLSFDGPAKPVVEKVNRSNTTVWLDKARTMDFRGVPENVWNFHIGGYQVCEKWLKDRKNRTLTAEDIVHYHRIVIALHETIRIMREIDEAINAHGGWPGAFASTAQSPEAKDAIGSRTPQRGKRASARVDLQQPNLFG